MHCVCANIFGAVVLKPRFKIDVVCRKGYFYCPTMNSHRPRSQNTSKEQALIPEKESRRT